MKEKNRNATYQELIDILEKKGYENGLIEDYKQNRVNPEGVKDLVYIKPSKGIVIYAAAFGSDILAQFKIYCQYDVNTQPCLIKTEPKIRDMEGFIASFDMFKTKKQWSLVPNNFRLYPSITKEQAEFLNIKPPYRNIALGTIKKCCYFEYPLNEIMGTGRIKWFEELNRQAEKACLHKKVKQVIKKHR